MLTISLSVPGASAQDPGAGGAEAGALSSGQSQLATRFKKLEALLLRSAEVEEATNPTRAELMKKAAELAKQVQLGAALVRAANSLEAKQYSQAIEDQKASLENFNKILALLQSEDRTDRLRDERDQIKRTIEETERLLRLESSLRGRTEGGTQIEKAASDQQKLAEKAAQIAKDINPDSKDAKDPKDSAEVKDSAEGKNPKESKDKEGQNKDPDGKSPDDKQSPDKQKGDDKPGDDKNSSDKNGDNKSPDEQSSGKKPEDKKSEDKKSDDKKSDDKKPEKSGDKPSGEDKGDKPKDGDKPSDGDKPKENPASGDKNSQNQPQQDKPSQPGDQSPPQSGESQPSSEESQQSDQAQQPQKPQAPKERAGDRLKKAQKNMEDAQKKLKEGEREGAVEKQREAEQELRAAIEELEEILRQLREEEIERSLTALEERLRLMLQLQNKVLDESKRLQEIGAGGNDRQVEIRANSLANDEKKIVGEAQRALLLLREEGTSAAFPESLSHIISDMQKVVDRLTKADVGKLTIGIEEDIVASLEELVAAMSEIKKENKERKENQMQAPGQQQGQPGEQPLVNQLAEMRLIKTLQLRINKRTQTLAEVLKDPSDPVGQAEAEDIQSQLRELSERQASIKQVTRDIVIGKNQQ